MNVALLELRRRPGRFAVIGSALVLLVLLMLFLSMLLTGLFRGSTGALRVHEADRFVFSDDARQSVLRSEISDAELRSLSAIAGVASADGFGISLLGVAIPGEDEPLDGAIGGYRVAGGRLPAPPAPGEGYADEHFADLGLSLGETVLVGPAEVPITVVGWVEDSNYLLQNGLWVDGPTWREVQNRNRPDAVVADDGWQVGIVRFVDGAEAAGVTRALESATRGEVLDEHDAIFAIPGVPEQNSTIRAVIYATAFVVALVVALFFALITLERTGLYAVLKALGATDRRLVVGVVAQAVVVALAAYGVGATLSWLLGLVIPPEIPVIYSTGQAVFVLVAVVVAAVLGGLASLRRVTRIEPASAIGSGI